MFGGELERLGEPSAAFGGTTLGVREPGGQDRVLDGRERKVGARSERRGIQQ